MLKMLMLFEETTQGGIPEWVTYVVMGVLLVGIVLMMILPQRKQRKQEQQMRESLKVGSKIITIGGIIGTIIELTASEFVLETGEGDNKTTMRFTKQAIYQIYTEKNETPIEKDPEEPEEIK